MVQGTCPRRRSQVGFALRSSSSWTLGHIKPQISSVGTRQEDWMSGWIWQLVVPEHTGQLMVVELGRIWAKGDVCVCVWHFPDLVADGGHPRMETWDGSNGPQSKASSGGSGLTRPHWESKRAYVGSMELPRLPKPLWFMMERMSLARFSENIHGLKPQFDSFSSSLTYQKIEELLSLFSAPSGSPRHPQWSSHYQSLSRNSRRGFSFLQKRKKNQAVSSSVSSVCIFLINLFHKCASVCVSVCSKRSRYPGYFLLRKCQPNISLYFFIHIKWTKSNSKSEFVGNWFWLIYNQSLGSLTTRIFRLSRSRTSFLLKFDSHKT